jgi:hypothetical protein
VPVQSALGKTGTVIEDGYIPDITENDIKTQYLVGKSPLRRCLHGNQMRVPPRLGIGKLRPVQEHSPSYSSGLPIPLPRTPVSMT